jgi:hypothetical protein
MRRDETIGDSERWLSAIAGGMLVLSSLRRRDAAAGALFAVGGAALIFRGIVGHGGFFETLGDFIGGELDAVRPGGSAGREELDAVDEAGAESFPASDPPSFTPTSGTEPDESA